MNDNINKNLIEANTKLVDEIRFLKKDKKMLQRRINKAIELIDLNICGGSINNAKELLDVLKGEYIYE